MHFEQKNLKKNDEIFASKALAPFYDGLAGTFALNKK